jgi:hypothetical protein
LRKTTILNTYNPNDQVLTVGVDASIDHHQLRFKYWCTSLRIRGELVAETTGWEDAPVFVGPFGALFQGSQIELRSWYACQRLQKPRIRGLSATGRTCNELLTGRLDDRRERFWSDLGLALPVYDYLWSNADHRDTTRQWAELAFWFPALSYAAGGTPIRGMMNENFSLYGPPDPFEIPMIGRLPLLASPLGITTHTYMTDNPYSLTWRAHERIGHFMSEGR